MSNSPKLIDMDVFAINSVRTATYLVVRADAHGMRHLRLAFASTVIIITIIIVVVVVILIITIVSTITTVVVVVIVVAVVGIIITITI